MQNELSKLSCKRKICLFAKPDDGDSEWQSRLDSLVGPRDLAGQSGPIWRKVVQLFMHLASQRSDSIRLRISLFAKVDRYK